MTLASIAVAADHRRRFTRRTQFRGAYPLKNIGRRQLTRGGDGFLQQRHQLSLQRPIICLGARAELRRQVVGNVLDRKIDRHNS